jgi:gamma-glutamylcyclotransferase (GGCT)/AIG2-like uncharacterized protein YtfP
MSRYLFLYGTLLPDHAPDEVARAVKKLEPVGEGFISGRLYDLGEYPGAVLDPDSRLKVFGVVFQLPNDAHLLPTFDSYEEFQPKSPRKSLFVRKRRPVTLADGSIVNSWVYEYNRDPKRAPLVRSGRYAQRNGQRRINMR